MSPALPPSTWHAWGGQSGTWGPHVPGDTPVLHPWEGGHSTAHGDPWEPPRAAPLGSEGHGVAHGDPISLETPPCCTPGVEGTQWENWGPHIPGDPPRAAPPGVEGTPRGTQGPLPTGILPSPKLTPNLHSPQLLGDPSLGVGDKEQPPRAPPHLTCHQLGSSWLTICSRSPAAKRSPASLQGMRLSEAGS